jgi:hypothetical protein
MAYHSATAAGNWMASSRSRPAGSARRPGSMTAGMPAAAQAFVAASYSGCSTIALPPPRRTGSAAASTRPSASSSMPVAAPISLVVENR